MDDERFDGLYLNVAQTTRGIEPLLDTVFSFLRRKTDFFAGPPGSGDQGTDKAIAKVNEVLLKHAEIYKKSQAKKAAPKKKAVPPKKKAKEEPPKPVAAAAAQEDDAVIEIGSDGKFDASAAEDISSAEKKDEEDSKPEASETPKPSAEPAAKGENTEDHKPEDDAGEDAAAASRPPPPFGNGGTVDGKYVWTQTLSELTVSVPLPENTRGRDLNVVMNKKHLKVALKSNKDAPLVDAPLTKAIICDDSFWTVEDGNRLVLQLQKLNQMEWWDSVCQGDPTIDVKTIQPENSSLNDLDNDTRKTVEKMMYDQRQKAMGKPSSDEEQKFSMLEKFKQQHPELDFSNAKIS